MALAGDVVGGVIASTVTVVAGVCSSGLLDALRTAHPIPNDTITSIKTIESNTRAGNDNMYARVFIVSLHFYYDHGDVVLAASAIGRLDQRVARFLGAAGVLNGALDFVVQHHFPQSIRTKDQHVANL